MEMYISNLGLSDEAIIKTIKENPGISMSALSHLIWDKYSLESKGYKFSTTQVYVSKAVRNLRSKGKVYSNNEGRQNRWFAKRNLIDTIKNIWSR